jgi:hypothetical protein
MNARKKGHGFELATIKRFNELGWECVSSRSESKRLDDAKVDLCYTDPFQVQCKATETAPNMHTLLKQMPQNNKMNVVFHKRNHKGTTVTMSEEDFFTLVKLSGLAPCIGDVNE